MNLVVAGTGYVGLVSGLGYAKLGHRVACVDIDADKIAKLELGEVPFHEVGLKELLGEMQDAGRIVFTTDLSSVLGSADIVMIAVGTPPGRYGEADLSYVFSVADAVGTHLNHEALIVMKSTVPVGTNRKVLERVKDAMRKAGREDLTSLIEIASLPEFLAEGKAIADFLSPSRIVIGADETPTHAMLDALHEGITAPRMFTTIENAELVKLAANAFLATKISFINEIANICERTGADVREIARGIGMDPRIGTAFFRAGIGYGGSCFPKDVSALHQIAGTTGYEFKLLSAVIEVNNRQREKFVKNIEYRLGNLQGRRVGVWGLAFKNGTDDIRESAAIDIVQRLSARGAEVCVFDPMATESARRVLSDRVEYAPTAIDAATGAEALLVLTEWPEFRDVSFPTLKEKMIEPRIFDGRNLLADLRLDTLGFDYEGVGISGHR
jgi:UDPglucose 6-dehydrogenase